MGYSETCYSKGTRIVLWIDQTQNGKWTCSFAVPRLLISGMLAFHDSASGEYLTEGGAKKAAFESAKKVLADSQQMRNPDSGSITNPTVRQAAEGPTHLHKRQDKG